MSDLFDLTGRRIVVTGGMGQLGAAFAIGICNRGGTVLVLDVDKDPKYSQLEFLELESAGRIVCYRVDITSPVQVSDVAREIVETYGPPHGLVNNAALDSPPDSAGEEVGAFERYPIDNFEKVMNVNVSGTMLACQQFGTLMAKEGRGSIINISSIYGILSPCQDIYEYRRQNGEEFFKPISYSVSKSAVLNLTRYLATYWAESNVRVNTLTFAGVFNNQDEEFLAEYTKRIPIRRMARAEEFVGSVIYLLSEASSYTTGANIVVDGGWSSW